VLVLLGISASTYGVGKGLQVVGGLGSQTAPPSGSDAAQTKSPGDPAAGN
jgi:hypothetical protein